MGAIAALRLQSFAIAMAPAIAAASFADSPKVPLARHLCAGYRKQQPPAPSIEAAGGYRCTSCASPGCSGTALASRSNSKQLGLLVRRGPRTTGFQRCEKLQTTPRWAVCENPQEPREASLSALRGATLHDHGKAVYI
eukprot:7457155-Alexandrium_andersonii.AAC.1